MSYKRVKDIFDEWNEAGCSDEALEDFVFSLENKSHYLETELYMMYGFISGWFQSKED